MGRTIHPSLERYQQIEARQGIPKWGVDYQPAIYATREEAPAISRPCIIYSAKLRRHLHALSAAEVGFILLALHYPGLAELLEGKVLSPHPTQHPLQSHPSVSHLNFPALRGTVAIADSLDRLKLHPTIRVPDPDDPQIKMEIPFPWIGDILLVLFGRHAPLYCVNWSIKESPNQFYDPTALGQLVRNYDAAAEKLRVRSEVEEIYYADGNIPTHFLTPEDCNQAVISNLRQIYGWHNRSTPFDPEQTTSIIDHFKAGLSSRTSPLSIIHWLIAKYRYEREHLAAVFYQAVWHRKLRIDLHDTLTLDRPMIPERSDILEDYAHFFKEV